MLPLGPRLEVKRLPPEKVLDWGFVLPKEDRGLSHVGDVLTAGPGYSGRAKLPLEVVAGNRIVYSTRVDTFKRGEVDIDIVEEASVIGIVNGSNG